MEILYKYKNVEDKLVWTQYEKEEGATDDYKESESPISALRYIDKYKLKISLDWISELGGSPTAVRVQATHDKDSSDLTGKDFKYDKIWAHYTNEFNITQFKGVDTNEDVELCLYTSPQSAPYYIVNQNLTKDNVIEIELERIYSGVITFNVTPIMSYGELTNLTQSIRVDQNKIASGEILLDTWNYRIIETEVTVEYENTTKKEVTTTTTVGSEGDESKTVITETKVIDPIISKTDKIYTLSLKYGLESYKFEDQKINNAADCFINFYDLETLPLDESLTELTTLEKVDYVLNNPEAIPTHVETIPVSILSGGQIIVNLELNSATCDLKPNKVYLCILNILTINDDGVQFLTRDYRYLYTSGIYNEYVDLVQDFKNLYLSIVPELNLQFNDNRIKQLYTVEGQQEQQGNPFTDLKWFTKANAQPNNYNKKVIFRGVINNAPDEIHFIYNDAAFKCDCAVQFNSNDYKLYLKEISNVSKVDSKGAIEIIPDTANSRVQNSTDAIKNEDSSIILVNYNVNLTYENVTGTIDVHAIKSNLLNTPIITENDKNAAVFLAERAGLENTIIMADDQIPAIGLSNSNGSDEEWYLEGTFLSEGFIHDGDNPYDDSQEGNDGLVLDLTEYGKPLTEQQQDDYSAKKYFLYYGSRNYSESLSEKDPTIRLNDLMTMDDLRDRFNTDFNDKAIAPMLFLTHGQATTDSKAGAHIVTLNIFNDIYLSQPHRANSDDKHAFDSTEPYLYPFWYTPKQILGTFLIKHADTKGGKQFVLTSNYFSMDFFKGSVQRRSIRNIPVYSSVRYVPNTHYIGDAQIEENSINKITHIHKVDGLDTLRKSQPAKFFTMGDLYATQLAQFAAITPYTTPKSYTIERSDWYKVHQDLSEVKNFPIHNQRVYSFTFDKNNSKAVNKINSRIQCGNVYLNEWNNFLPSNNLVFNPVASYDQELEEERQNLEANLAILEYEIRPLKERYNSLSPDNPEYKDLQNQINEIQAALDNNPYYNFVVKRLDEIENSTNTDYPVVTFNDNQDFSPLSEVLPDTSKFILEINPDGTTAINFLPKDLNVNVLFYWDWDTNSYKKYDSLNGKVRLYKYGKFTKNICMDLTQFKSGNSIDIEKLVKYFEENHLNINNYNIIEGYNEIDSDLLCFHPISPFTNNNFIEVEMPLKYNQSDGMYTTKKAGKKQTSGMYTERDINVPYGNSAPIKGLPYYPIEQNNEYQYESITRL